VVKVIFLGIFKGRGRSRFLAALGMEEREAKASSGG